MKALLAFFAGLPNSIQQVFLLAFIMAVLVAANLAMAVNPSADDTMRGVVEAIIVRMLALVGLGIKPDAKP